MFDFSVLLFSIQCFCVAFHFVYRPLAFSSFWDVYVRMRLCVCVFLLYCFLGCSPIECYYFYYFYFFFLLSTFSSSLIWTIGLIQINDWLIDWLIDWLYEYTSTAYEWKLTGNMALNATDPQFMSQSAEYTQHYFVWSPSRLTHTSKTLC